MINQEDRYLSLISALLDKTKAGKLRWNATPDPQRFLAAVKGEQTFEIRSSTAPDGIHPEPFQLQVIVRGFDGQKTLEFRISTHTKSPAYELFSKAQADASRIDDRINEALELLNSL